SFCLGFVINAIFNFVFYNLSTQEKRELADLIIAQVNPPPPPQSSRRNSSSSAGSQAHFSQSRTSPQSESPSIPPSPQHSQPSSPQRATAQAECSSSSSLNTSTRHPNEPSYESEPRSSLNAGNKNVHSNLNISTFNLNDIKDETDIIDLSVRQLTL